MKRLRTGCIKKINERHERYRGSVWATAYFVFPDLPADMLGFGASALTFLVVTPLTQGVDPPKPLRDTRGNEVAMRDRLGLIGVVGDRNDRRRPVE